MPGRSRPMSNCWPLHERPVCRNCWIGCRTDWNYRSASAGVRFRRVLSAGERQRVAVARALLGDPAVLVLDVATGALDPATEAQVIAGYQAIMRGRTTVIITHRLELARLSDRVVVLDHGRITEEGPP